MGRIFHLPANAPAEAARLANEFHVTIVLWEMADDIPNRLRRNYGEGLSRRARSGRRRAELSPHPGYAGFPTET